jgi:hypothetical protein
MQPERRRQVVLAGLVVVLAIAIYRAWPDTAVAPAGSSNSREAARADQGAEIAPPDVKLEALKSERPKPEGPNRNLFRFGRPPAEPAAPQPVVKATPAGPSTPIAPPPPTVPPIPLKFVGTMKVGGRLMAVLSDGSGRDPVYGFEGDTVLGQYRLVRVGADSIEMAYLDGRGRQTIRFSGS